VSVDVAHHLDQERRARLKQRQDLATCGQPISPSLAKLV
jgi:hypothetical protein